jgi:hypothetical protein
MAKLDSENAISDDLETSKFLRSAPTMAWWRLEKLPLPKCKHIKSGSRNILHTSKNILECAPLTTKYFNVLPPKETQSSSEKR